MNSPTLPVLTAGVLALAAYLRLRACGGSVRNALDLRLSPCWHCSRHWPQPCISGYFRHCTWPRLVVVWSY